MKKTMLSILLSLLLAVNLFSSEISFSAMKADEAVFSDEGLVWTAYSGSVSASFSVETEGEYNIVLDYISLSGKNDSIELDVAVDGNSLSSYPASLPRTWYYGPRLLDEDGNEMRAVPHQDRNERCEMLRVKNGFEAECLTVYLEKGEHTICLSAGRTGLIIRSLSVIRKDKSYPDAKGGKVSGPHIRIEAEDIYSSSSSVLNGQYDRSSASVSPSDPFHLVVNIAGGSNWNTDGESLSYRFYVNESGNYYLGFKYRQAFSKILNSSRKLYIDGRIPSASVERIDFSPSSSWSLKTMDDAVYLEKGFHFMTLEVVPGPYSEIAKELRDIVSDLNGLYSSMIMITGTNPDRNREYNLDREMPDLIPAFESASEHLRSVSAALAPEKGEKSVAPSALTALISQLDSFVLDPESIPYRIASFKSNISSLSSWIYSLADSPLDLDWIEVAGDPNDFSSLKSGLFNSLKYSFRSLLSSFDTKDSKKNGEITIWVQAGRDQMQVVEDLIRERYSKSNQPKVEVKLVQTGIEQAILAGSGPDVVLYLGYTSPITLAMRNAVVPLSSFEDFESHIASYTDEKALTPYLYEGECYALPLTEAFPLLFYRTDILSRLDLEVPTTWDGLRKAIPVVERANLEVGVPSSITTFLTLLYQYGGQLYSDDKTGTELKSAEAVAAFEFYTSLFTDYGLPLSYDFFNRFRSGEMPLAIADYTEWGRLGYAAPEIRGLYKIAPVPSSLSSPVVSSGGQCAVLLDSANDKAAAWDFLKWFTSVEIQTEFGLRIEAILGSSARYQSVSDEVVKNLGWLPDELETVLEAKHSSSLAEQIPGSYYTDRNLLSAFRNVVIQDRNPREMLNSYSLIIDREIERKRETLKKEDAK